jgi:hypothetical protein
VGEKHPLTILNVEEDEAVAFETFCRRGLTKAEAEDLLDWLEANGYRRFELDFADGEGFVVRWQAAAGRN